MQLSFQQAQIRYGQINDGTWAAVGFWCQLLPIDPEVACDWINTATGFSTEKIYCNRDMAGPLTRALANVKNRGIISQLKTFDGCFHIRSVRGFEQLSTHSYALAVDINAATNVMGTKGDMSPELATCFADEGFRWGGRFARPDPQHFSYAWE